MYLTYTAQCRRAAEAVRAQIEGDNFVVYCEVGPSSLPRIINLAHPVAVIKLVTNF